MKPASFASLASLASCASLASLAWLRALGLVLALGGCDSILHLPTAKSSPGLTCTDGDCSCTAPLTSCSGTFDGTCPVDLDTDGSNCGRCGHDCLGGACKAGVCQPIILDNTLEPYGLSLYDDKLFLGICNGTSTAFDTLPVGGGTPTSAITNPQCGSIQALLGSTLYWGGQPGGGAPDPVLLSVDLAGTGAPTQFATGNASTIAPSTPGFVYYSIVDSAENDSDVYAVTLPGGPTTQIYAGEIGGLTANSLGAYWVTSTGGLYFVPNGSSTPQVFPGASNSSIFADDQNVFYSTDANGLEVVPVAGGTPKVLAPHVTLSLGAVYGDDFFWLDEAQSTVNTVPVAGGTPTVLAKDFAFCNATGLAVDANAVYFVGGTLVVKVAR